MPHDRSPDLSLTARALDHPDSAQLLHDYAVERRAMVGFDDPPDLDRKVEYDPPVGLFVVAYTALGEPVACGGIGTYAKADRVAEVRKMFVVPHHRNQGLARRVLAHLESFGAAQGVQRVLLETGSYNRAATHLYPSAGYDPIPPYVPGRPDFNRAYAKTLTESAVRGTGRCVDPSALSGS
ncbi:MULTISPECIES: GNAT family N-acetyltransferase [unclassified Nocardia]|uniref:GNAT family N-acetyltransferase n=1 Tax=unclassified Nocardia TaxID=2637762 RepID=UPI00339F2B78